MNITNQPLTRHFQVGVIIQALDPKLFIWYKATILGFESDWCARVKWVDWSKTDKIEVPENIRRLPEQWPIRKWTQKTISSSQEDTVSDPSTTRRTSKRRRSTAVQLDFNPNTLYRHEKVCLSIFKNSIPNVEFSRKRPFWVISHISRSFEILSH